MAGIFILALGVWVFVLWRRVSALERRLKGPEPVLQRFAQAVPADAPQPPRPEPRSPRPPEPAAPDASPVIPGSEPARRAPPAAEPRPALGRALSSWLAQNGLAWMGGAALTLGGLFLVVYAAERGFFTPLLRVLAASTAGAIMILASEWIRRQKNAPGGRHLLAASLAAGAGASTLYGAIWAAHSLYGLAPLALAGVLITSVSAALLGLALLHGEALAVLAVLGAFAIPLVTGRSDWLSADLDRFLVILILTGSAAAGLRRWAWAGFAVLAGALAWGAEGLFRGQTLQAEIAVGAAAIGAALPVFWRPWAPPENLASLRLSDRQADLAVWSTSGVSILLWVVAALDRDPIGQIVALSAVLAIAGAAMAAAGITRRSAFFGPALAPALGVALAAGLAKSPGALGAGLLIFALATVVAGAGLAFGLRRPGARESLVAAGGPGAAALATVAWITLRDGPVAPSWLLPFAVAVLLSGGAWLLARRVGDKTTDRGLALWLAATVELAFLAVQAASPPHFAPATQALLAVGLATLALRLGWSGLSQTAVFGGLVVLATMLRPSFVGDVLAKRLDPLGFSVVVAAATGELFLAGRMLRARAVRDSEALVTWSLMVLLLGVFLLIHLFAADGSGVGVGRLLEAGLRTDVILATALVLYQRARDDEGPIARWRRLAVLWIGASYGLLQVLILNPWSGLGERPLGPPILDTLALSYLAPAALLALMTRQRRAPLLSRRLAAVCSLLFALAWVLLEIRRGFHANDLAVGSVERPEACVYALALLLTARGFWRLKAGAGAASVGAYLGAAAAACSTIAVLFGALVFCWYSSPWWGPRIEPLHGAGEALLLLIAYAAGILATFWLEEASAHAGWRWLQPASLSVAMAELFVLVTLIARWAFQGAQMHAPGLNESVETWTFSALWAVFGFGSLVAGGVWRAGRQTLRWIGLAVLTGALAKVLLFDMERLSGVIRAGSFLAVGALLIFAALAARRLDAGGSFLFGRSRRAAEGEPSVGQDD